MTKPQRIPRDEGTPEHTAKRLALVVNRYAGKAEDPILASSELGRLAAQGYLASGKNWRAESMRMYDAGMELLKLWRSVYPQNIGSTLGRYTPVESVYIDDPDKHEKDLRSLTAYFGNTRSYLLNAVRDCVVYDKVLESGKLQKLRKGLKLIMEWQKGRRA